MASKGKGKKAKFASKLFSEIMIKSSVTDEMYGAIEISIKQIKLQDIEFSPGTKGQLTVSYGNHLIGKLENILLPTEGGDVQVDYQCYLEISPPDNQLLDAFIATPFLFTLSSHADASERSPTRKTGVKKKPSETTMSVYSLSRNPSRQTLLKEKDNELVVGQGNLDILPLILEKGKYESNVILEVPGPQDTIFFQRSASENPSLVVILTDVKGTLVDFPLTNVMWLTVESIFNPCEPYFMDDAEYTVVFPIPLMEITLDDPSTEESGGDEDLKNYGNLEFDNSKPSQTKKENYITKEAYPSSEENQSHCASNSSETETKSSPMKTVFPRTQTRKNIEKQKECKTKSATKQRNVTKKSHLALEHGKQISPRDSTQDSFHLDNTKPILKDNPYINIFERSRNESAENDEDTSGGELVMDASHLNKSAAQKSEKPILKPSLSKTDTKKYVRNAELESRLLDYTLIEFPTGLWTEEPMLDLRKTWVSLSSIYGGPSKHAQIIQPNSKGILSKFELNLSEKMEAGFEPKIVWNMVRPYWLSPNDQQNIIKKIYRHGVWPIEVVVNGGSSKVDRESSEEKEKVKKKPSSPKKITAARSYIAWVDLSKLLYPGNDSIRVAGHLQLFDKDEGEFLWGLQSTILAKPAETMSAGNETADESELHGERKQFKRGTLRKDSTNKFCNIKSKLRKHSLKTKNANDSTEESDNTDKSFNPVYPEETTEESNSDSEQPKMINEISESSGDVQFDSGRKTAQKVDSLPSKLTNLEKEYSALKSKYDKIVSVYRASGFQSITSHESTSLSELASMSKDNQKRLADIAKSDLEEMELKKLLLTRDALDTWSVLQHKKLLMERYALASLRKKAKEELVLFEPEKFHNEEDEPIFIVIEIKFLKPLVPKHTLKKIEAEIQDLLPKREQEVVTGKVRYTPIDFQACLNEVTALASQEYLDYITFGEKVDEHGFYDHLIKSRAHQRMTELLREGLTSFVKDVIGTPLNESHIIGPENKDYVGWLYCRLMDEISTIVNKFVMNADYSTPLHYEDDRPNISKEELFVFATEAAEERDNNRVKFYMSKILSDEGLKEAKNWSDYAVICLRLGDYPKAVECLREALALDIRHKESLLMYGVLLAMAGMFDVAELVFNALVEFHPFFSQGWITLHTFYLLVGRSIGADAALINGTKCSELEKEEFYKPPQLAWDNNWDERKKCYYLKTAIYLLSFNLYEMAEVCLAQELEETGKKSEMFTYYLSVCHHIQGRYEDSSSHLSRALAEDLAIQPDPRLWVILGHNKWQQGHKKEAVQLYMEALASDNPPMNSHMAFIRGGFFFLEIEKAELAHQMFLRAVKRLGTPMGWLGLGISLYMLNKLEDAEFALNEANILDNRLAVAWAYLGLICLHKNRHEQFRQCFNEANRLGLDDKKLKIKMEDCLKKDSNSP